jgi:hypothetical protein
MNPATPTDWAEWLAAFRQRLVAAHKWDEKESKLRLRDAHAVVRNGKVYVLSRDDPLPEDAVPVFLALTVAGWKLPVEFHERLTGIVAKATLSQHSPRDIVLGLLSKVEHPNEQGESDEIRQKRHSAAFWGHQLLDACEDETLAGVVETDTFWQVPLAAYQAGYRHAILNLYRNPQLLTDLTKAQAFQSGRGPDELTRRLEESWLALRSRGQDPKPGEVAEEAGGRWDEIDDCWEFDDLDGLPSLTHGALRDRLDKIRARHSQ